MSLTTDVMQRITKEVVLGQPSSAGSPEENDFRQRVERNVADIQKQGLVVDIPGEWPDMGDGGENQDRIAAAKAGQPHG